jgi:hypothetical protein
MARYSRPRGFEDENGRLTEAPTPKILRLALLNFLSVHHLYQKPTGELCFSLLSKADRKARAPHRFSGGFRLQGDTR